MHQLRGAAMCLSFVCGSKGCTAVVVALGYSAASVVVADAVSVWGMSSAADTSAFPVAVVDGS